MLSPEYLGVSFRGGERVDCTIDDIWVQHIDTHAVSSGLFHSEDASPRQRPKISSGCLFHD